MKICPLMHENHKNYSNIFPENKSKKYKKDLSVVSLCDDIGTYEENREKLYQVSNSIRSGFVEKEKKSFCFNKFTTNFF